MKLWLPSTASVAAATPLYRSSIPAPAQHHLAGTSTVVVPGDPAASQLLLRMSLRDEAAMPPVATSTSDPTGLDLVERWIRGLAD